MAISDCAQAAVSTFPNITIETPYGAYQLPVIMVAISGAEDGFGNGPGDPLSQYVGWSNYSFYERYSCNGYTSFGSWQNNLPYNHDQIEQISGIPSSNPCGQAAWLADYTHSAQASLVAYNSAGLGDWSTWWRDARNRTGPGEGPYHQYLDHAQAAVQAVQGQASSGAGGTPSSAIPVLAAAGWFLLFAMAVIGFEEIEGAPLD